jgi:hypothetical protein
VREEGDGRREEREGKRGWMKRGGREREEGDGGREGGRGKKGMEEERREGEGRSGWRKRREGERGRKGVHTILKDIAIVYGSDGGPRMSSIDHQRCSPKIALKKKGEIPTMKKLKSRASGSPKL